MNELFQAVNARLKSQHFTVLLENKTTNLPAGEVPEVTPRPNAMLKPDGDARAWQSNKRRGHLQAFIVELSCEDWDQASKLSEKCMRVLTEAPLTLGPSWEFVSLDYKDTRYENADRHWKAFVRFEAKVKTLRPGVS